MLYPLPMPQSPAPPVGRFAPNVPGCVEQVYIQTPLDLERELGLYNGNVMHLEMSLDQMFMFRPAAGLAGYRTPIAGLFLTGETPDLQLGPSLSWFAEAAGVRRWTIVGDDYVWPRRSAQVATEHLRRIGGTVCDEMYVPLGTEDFSRVLRRVEASGCDAVLILLIGNDAVEFNRAFAAAGMDRDILRFSSLIDENVLLASGAENTRGLMTSAGYFEDLATTAGLDFAAWYARRFGPEAPVLNSLGESCYEGVRLLTALMRRAGATDVRSMVSVSDGLSYESPRGTVELWDRHLRQRVFLAAADGLTWDVIQQL